MLTAEGTTSLVFIDLYLLSDQGVLEELELAFSDTFHVLQGIQWEKVKICFLKFKRSDVHQRNRFYNAHAYIKAEKSNWNRVFTQANSGERRTPFTLQRTGTKPCGCGTFQVLALLSVIVFAQIPTLIETELPITNTMNNVGTIYWKPVSTWVAYISYQSRFIQNILCSSNKETILLCN